jgi:hypothetical protein
VGTRFNPKELLDPATGAAFWMHDHVYTENATAGGKESNSHACAAQDRTGAAGRNEARASARQVRKFPRW